MAYDTQAPARHQVLVVGAGSIGERHVRSLLATGRAAVAVCEPDEARRRLIAGRYPLGGCFGSLEEALGQRCDAAVIATPAHLHVPIASRLAEAGLHLLIEKPLSTSMEGIDRLRRQVGAGGLVAAVAYNYRAHPALAAMRKAVVEGRFGTIAQLYATGGSHFPTGRPAYRQIYYRDRATGGGAIQDALTHLINAGEWLAGPVQGVVADASHQVLDGVSVEDTVHLIARHGSVLGCYCYNQYQSPPEVSITVNGTLGTARFEDHNNRWLWMNRPRGQWQVESAGAIEPDSTYIAQARAFLDSIDRSAPPLCSLEEGIQTLRVNLAALESSGRMEKFHAIAPV